MCETLLQKMSDQLRGFLAPLGGPLDSERAHWAFSDRFIYDQSGMTSETVGPETIIFIYYWLLVNVLVFVRWKFKLNIISNYCIFAMHKVSKNAVGTFNVPTCISF